MKLVSETDKKALMDVARAAQKAGVTVEEVAALLIEFDPPSMDDVIQKMRGALTLMAEVNNG